MVTIVFQNERKKWLWEIREDAPSKRLVSSDDVEYDTLFEAQFRVATSVVALERSKQ